MIIFLTLNHLLSASIEYSLVNIPSNLQIIIITVHHDIDVQSTTGQITSLTCLPSNNFLF